MPKRRALKSPSEIVERWIRGWLFHYRVKVPRARMPKEIIEAIEEEVEKRD